MVVTAVMLLAIAIIFLYKSKFSNENKNFFDRDFTQTLKGICCIIVILVHIPTYAVNPLQDMVGSFAYICVTLFFLISGYGLEWSVKNKKDYLKTFPRKRLISLIVPLIIFCLIDQLIRLEFKPIMTNPFVSLILVFYIVFYLTHRFLPEKFKAPICVAFVVIYSLVGRLTGIGIGLNWFPEAMGFAYGIIFAFIIDKFKTFAQTKFYLKATVFCILSLFLGLIYLKFKPVVFWGDYVLKVALGLAIITFILFIGTHLQIGNRATLFMGKISYEIYLVPTLIIHIFYKSSILPPSGVYILLVIVVSICMATVLHFLSKPLIALLSKDKTK